MGRVPVGEQRHVVIGTGRSQRSRIEPVSVGAPGARVFRTSAQVAASCSRLGAARSVATRMMFRTSVGRPVECSLVDRVEDDSREHGGVRLPERARDAGAAAGERADDVDRDDPTRGEPVVEELRELERGHVERHAVGVERVEHDHVVAVVVTLQVATAVVDLDVDAAVAWQREPAVRGLDDGGIELDHRYLHIAEVPPDALRRRGPPRPITRIRFASGL